MTLSTKIETMFNNSQYDEACELLKGELKFTFEGKFKRHGKYFDGNTSIRDIYEITLIRGSRKYVFDFGLSLNNSSYYLDERIRGRSYYLDGKARTGNQTIIDIKKYLSGGGKLTKVEGKAPKLYDILACLQKYDAGTFENFCDEFGFDQDSRTAEKIYNAVADEYANIQRLFTESEIEVLQLIH